MNGIKLSITEMFGIKNQWGIIAVGVGLILLLGILAAGIEALVLCPGHDIVIERHPGRVGGAVPLPAAYWIVWVIYIIIVTWIIAAVIGFIFIPKVRKQILIGSAVFAVVLIVGNLLYHAHGPEVPLVDEEIPVCQETPPLPFAHLDLPPSEPVEREELPPMPEAPGWAIYPAAGALGIILAFFLLRRRRGKLRPQTWEEEIAEVASQTSEELRQGLSITDVVMRCWTRMVEILSLRAGVRDAPSLTPREFAKLLRDHGFHERAIGRLTSLFEEVRYGNMLAEPRREEALAAVSDIEHAYKKT